VCTEESLFKSKKTKWLHWQVYISPYKQFPRQNVVTGHHGYPHNNFLFNSLLHNLIHGSATILEQAVPSSREPDLYSEGSCSTWHWLYWVRPFVIFLSVSKKIPKEYSKGEGILISLSSTHVTEWNSANCGNGNATRGKREKLNFQATEHASLRVVS
jgi:hypothetical protein